MMMSNWDNFHKDLHYEYTRGVLKSLNNAEMYYLRVLRDGVDNTINSSINYVQYNYHSLSHLHDRDDWRDYYNDDGELDLILKNILNSNINKGLEPLYGFYRTGSGLAYAHMQKEFLDTEADTLALQYLYNFISRVIESINLELQFGVRELIGKSIEDNNLDSFAEDMLDIQYTGGESKFHLGKNIVKNEGLTRLSTDTRCLFTAKTEYARAVNTGLLQGYSNYGVDEFDWVTSGLSNTCNACRDIEANNPYSLEDILSMGCPHHVNCSCSVKGRLSVNLQVNSYPRVVNLTRNI